MSGRPTRRSTSRSRLRPSTSRSRLRPSTSRSRPRPIRARILAVIVLLAIVLAAFGLTRGWFASNWLKAVAAVGIILGLGGLLRTFLGKGARGEIINLLALGFALAALIVGNISGPRGPAPEPDLSPFEDLLPYRVTGAGELGLLVRTCPSGSCGCSEPDCSLLGTAGENSRVWVQCSLDSGYVPPGESNSLWHKIRWPNSSGGTRQFFDSDPTSPHFGWVFGRYVTAAGPNDSPPSC